MLRSDRTLTEKMFLAGVVPVLCCTAGRPSRAAGRGVFKGCLMMPDDDDDDDDDDCCY